MKYLLTLLLCLATQAAQAQDSWTVIKSKNGKASIEIPKAPEMVTETMPSEVGEVVMNMQILDLSAGDGDNMTMGLMTLEYPVNMKDSINSPEKLKEFYDAAMNGAASNMGGTITTQEDVKENGHPGREFKIEIMGGMAVITMKYFQVKDMGYIAQVITKGDKVDNEEARRFLDSFKIEDD